MPTIGELVQEDPKAIENPVSRFDLDAVRARVREIVPDGDAVVCAIDIEIRKEVLRRLGTARRTQAALSAAERAVEFQFAENVNSIVANMKNGKFAERFTLLGMAPDILWNPIFAVAIAVAALLYTAENPRQ